MLFTVLVWYTEFKASLCKQTFKYFPFKIISRLVTWSEWSSGRKINVTHRSLCEIIQVYLRFDKSLLKFAEENHKSEGALTGRNMSRIRDKANNNME